MNVRALCFVALSLSSVVACSSSTTSGEDLTEGTTDTASSELALCNASACGPALGMPTLLCSDGSTGGSTGRCIRTKTTKCHWEIRQCPPAPTPVPVPPPKLDCTAGGACGPGLGMPSQLCWDGSTAGPTCVEKGGKCGWEITTCPAPPPELVCGKNVCSKGQTCCEGMPLPQPTCINGTMCPISQRKHKKDISYLSQEESQRLSDELMSFRIATYHYKSESETDRKQLGFIIDDVAPSSAVMASGERVDMYGYQTMAVAALQAQARDLADMKRQVEELKRTCAATAKKR